MEFEEGITTEAQIKNPKSFYSTSLTVIELHSLLSLLLLSFSLSLIKYYSRLLYNNLEFI
jgi:hypothetical protein